MMSKNGRHTSKQYGWLKQNFSKAQSKRMLGSKQSVETIARKTLKATGTTRSAETKQKMSVAAKNKPAFSEQHRLNMSLAATKRPTISDTTREKLQQRSYNREKLNREHKLIALSFQVNF